MNIQAVTVSLDSRNWPDCFPYRVLPVPANHPATALGEPHGLAGPTASRWGQASPPGVRTRTRVARFRPSHRTRRFRAPLRLISGTSKAADGVLVVKRFSPVQMIILEVEQEQSPNRHRPSGTFAMSEVLSRDTAGTPSGSRKRAGDANPYAAMKMPTSMDEPGKPWCSISWT